jgi:hypothetical protein
MGAMGGDIWVATRTSRADAFGTPARMTSLCTADDESKVSMTPDGLFAVIASTKAGGAGGSDLWETSRASIGQAFAALSETDLAAVDTSDDEYDPWMSGDRLRIYYAPIPSTQHLALATRATTTAPFAAGVTIAELDSGSGDADPTLSPDERVIVFSSVRAGNGDTDLWYAVRSDATVPFGTPRLVPDVNTSNMEGDPHLSADGCTLYFASDRDNGQYDLFAAPVQ